jgi:hypothetical protein
MASSGVGYARTPERNRGSLSRLTSVVGVADAPTAQERNTTAVTITNAAKRAAVKRLICIAMATGMNNPDARRRLMPALENTPSALRAYLYSILRAHARRCFAGRQTRAILLDSTTS